MTYRWRLATSSPDDPPEYDPDPDDDGVFADARAEMDQWWTEHEETTDGNA
jgi:hypothetical protein